MGIGGSSQFLNCALTGLGDYFRVARYTLTIEKRGFPDADF